MKAKGSSGAHASTVILLRQLLVFSRCSKTVGNASARVEFEYSWGVSRTVVICFHFSLGLGFFFVWLGFLACPIKIFNLICCLVFSIDLLCYPNY